MMTTLGPMLYNMLFVYFNDIMDLLIDDILIEEVEYQNTLEDQNEETVGQEKTLEEKGDDDLPYEILNVIENLEDLANL